MSNRAMVAAAALAAGAAPGGLRGLGEIPDMDLLMELTGCSNRDVIDAWAQYPDGGLNFKYHHAVNPRKTMIYDSQDYAAAGANVYSPLVFLSGGPVQGRCNMPTKTGLNNNSLAWITGLSVSYDSAWLAADIGSNSQTAAAGGLMIKSSNAAEPGPLAEGVRQVFEHGILTFKVGQQVKIDAAKGLWRFLRGCGPELQGFGAGTPTTALTAAILNNGASYNSVEGYEFPDWLPWITNQIPEVSIAWPYKIAVPVPIQLRVELHVRLVTLGDVRQ